MIETLIVMVGGLLSTAAILGLRKVNATVFVAKYGSIIEKTFNIIDPVMARLLSGYSDNIREAVQLVVARVGDNELAEDDIVVIANYILEKYDPSLAVVKEFDPASEEGKAALELIENLNKLRDGVELSEIMDIVKNLEALV